jgi:hypothetical protein
MNLRWDWSYIAPKNWKMGIPHQYKKFAACTSMYGDMRSPNVVNARESRKEAIRRSCWAWLTPNVELSDKLMRPSTVWITCCRTTAHTTSVRVAKLRAWISSESWMRYFSHHFQPEISKAEKDTNKLLLVLPEWVCSLGHRGLSRVSESSKRETRSSLNIGDRRRRKNKLRSLWIWWL